jgi:hypothetical protein
MTLSPGDEQAISNAIQGQFGDAGRVVGCTAAELLAREFLSIPWTIPTYLPQGLALLAGRPKIGKSWLVLAIAIAVASGGEVLGQACEEGAVLYAALEDGERRLQGRLAILSEGMDSDNGWGERLTLWTQMPPLDEGGLDRLREWLQANPNARLIIIDVFSRVRPPSGNSHSYTDDYHSLVPLKELADEHGIAILVVHHTRKADAVDKLELINGTNGLAGAADTVLVMDRNGKDVTLHGRGRDTEEIETALQFDAATCQWSALGPASQVHLGEAEANVLAALEGSDVPLKARAIADQTGLKVTYVRVILSRLVDEGKVDRPVRGTYALRAQPGGEGAVS